MINQAFCWCHRRLQYNFNDCTFSTAILSKQNVSLCLVAIVRFEYQRQSMNTRQKRLWKIPLSDKKRRLFVMDLSFMEIEFSNVED